MEAVIEIKTSKGASSFATQQLLAHQTLSGLCGGDCAKCDSHKPLAKICIGCGKTVTDEKAHAETCVY